MSTAPEAPTSRVRFLPRGATRDAALLLTTRGVRAFGDGFVSVLLPLHLTLLGYNELRIGAITAITLLGSAALTLLVGLVAVRLTRRFLLMLAALLMMATGFGFAIVRDFWPLLLIAFVGTLNPSSGDVSIFLPTEQTLLPQTVAATERTALFARYGLIGALVGAVGALCAGVPGLLTQSTGLTLRQGIDSMFVLYGLLGLICLLIYRRISPWIEPVLGRATAPLGPSKRIVYTLSALFSLDSFAGGLVVQSILALWILNHFGASAAGVGQIFFWVGLCAASSQLLAPVLARRIGLIRTMVFTHLPSNMLLLLVPFMPSLPLAIGLLLVRGALSQMDVPARQSYVMAVVTPAERPAAASITNVPRSLAAAFGPALAGWLLMLSPFGWPLILGGGLKATYDLLLLFMFQAVRPDEERQHGSTDEEQREDDYANSKPIDREGASAGALEKA